MISLQANNSKHLSEKEMCQKSNIGTTIGFVNIQEHTLLKTIPKEIWNRGIITLVVRMIEQYE
jgi:hypothetical protein